MSQMETDFSSRKLLPRDFYTQPTLDAARDLLGKLVVTRVGGLVRGGIVVETEAYLGTGDGASHSRNGKTERNASMFGSPGCAYVYFTYGMHWMLNVVTQPEGVGEAALIRAVEPLIGIEAMRSARKLAASSPNVNIGNGPAKLAQALGVVREGFDGADLSDENSVIQIWDIGRKYASSEIASASRIGITADADKPWRFYARFSDFVSRRS
jgi:DNA-3-methyladenine glycosylase